LIVISLSLTACVDHPIGDPEASKVDERYVGVWTGKLGDEHELLVIRPYDARTYLVHILAYTEETPWEFPAEFGRPVKPVKNARGAACTVYKGWLTSIGDVPFLTLEERGLEYVCGLSDKTTYFVARLKLDEGVLSWQLVNGGSALATPAKNGPELEKVVRDHRDSKDLYVPEIYEWRKCEDKALIESVVTAFNDME
jgi:hypothetical protein